MVVEDEDGIVGYAVAALNIKSYNQKMAVSWIPELQLKYPLEDITNDVSSNVQVSATNLTMWDFYLIDLSSIFFFNATIFLLSTPSLRIDRFTGSYTVLSLLHYRCAGTTLPSTCFADLLFSITHRNGPVGAKTIDHLYSGSP